MSARYTGGLVYSAPGGWSAQFNGTTQYLRVSANTAIDVGSGDFTINVWALPFTKTNGVDNIFGYGVYTMMLYHNNTSWTLEVSNNGSSNQVVITAPVTLNFWQYLTVVKSGTTVTLYKDAVLQSSGTISGSVNTSGKNLDIGANGLGNGQWFTGYISNYQLIKGTAVVPTIPSGALQPVSGTTLLTCRYPTFVDGSVSALSITNNGSTQVITANPFPTSQLPNPALGGAGNGVYTMSQYAALKAANLWPAFDPYYENVTLNLHGNAGTVLPFNTDASTNNFQVTQVGDTRPSNYTPFITDGYWSNLFTGTSNSNYLSIPRILDSTVDITLECWIYMTSTAPANGAYIAAQYVAAGADRTVFIVSSGVLALQIGSTFVSGTIAISVGSWNHVAFVRSGNGTNNWSIYVNGVRDGQMTYTGTYQNTPFTIGATNNLASSQFPGYISNLRLLKGTALYSGASFTPPTAPLTAITNTALLTCQSNRIIDNSASPNTITVNGTVAVNPLQPFTAPTGTSAYGSGYFDGTGDWLTPPTGQTALTLGTSDFTIEMWAYPTTQVRGNPALFTSDPGAGLANTILVQFIGTTGQTILWVNNTNLTASSTTNYIRLNQWNHIAICRSGGNTYTFYINGVAVNNVATNSTSLTTSSWYLGYWTVADNAYTGYLSNFRIVKGTVVYTGAFTPPTSPLTAITNTSLLTVQTNAPSQNNTFLDSSTNNFVITRAGNTTQGTFSPYGNNWSVYLNGSGDYLTAPASSAFAFGTDALTIEMWVYMTAYPANYSVLAANRPYNSGNNTTWFTGLFSTGVFRFSDSLGSVNIDSPAGAVPLNAWTHLAAVRSSTGTNGVVLYINGIAVAQGTCALNFSTTTNPVIIGTSYDPSNYYIKGYISNLRIVKGTAVYTSAFTPSAVPLTAITNTSLLTFQSGRFVDNSANGFTISTNGTPNIQRFSPFAATYYQPSVVGGSGYFDGSGDFLSFATNQAPLLLGSSDFTFEAWVYRSSGTGTATIFCGQSDLNTVAGSGYVFYVSSGSSSDLYIGGTGYGISSPNPSVGVWAHVAWARTGGVYSTYLNGARVATRSDLGTGAVNNGATTYAPSLGAFSNGGSPLAGYIADARLIKGSGGYNASSSTITIPTAPLTAVSNTSLLVSATNAGIFDNSMMTDWETLGGAQLNTAFKKYGSGSISMLASGDYCRSTQPSTMGDINGGDFTIEFWVYFTSVAANRALISKYGNTAENAGGLGYVLQFQQSVPSLRFVLGVGGGTDAVYDFAWSPAISTWYHVAVTRSGSSARAFVNGSQIGSTTTVSTSDVASPNATQIGKTHTVAQYLLGYMDDIRVTRGVARYTTNFTPPTSQVQDQ